MSLRNGPANTYPSLASYRHGGLRIFLQFYRLTDLATSHVNFATMFPPTILESFLNSFRLRLVGISDEKCENLHTFAAQTSFGFA
jgi:hypothetical protein